VLADEQYDDGDGGMPGAQLPLHRVVDVLCGLEETHLVDVVDGNNLGLFTTRALGRRLPLLFSAGTDCPPWARAPSPTCGEAHF
jgi:hypothetical protein